MGRSGTEEADELVGVSQPDVISHQSLYVRYSNLSEGMCRSQGRLAYYNHATGHA